MRKKSKKKQIVAMTLALSVLSSSVGMCGASAAEALPDTDDSGLRVTVVPLADSNADTDTPADDTKTEKQPVASTGDNTDQPTVTIPLLTISPPLSARSSPTPLRPCPAPPRTTRTISRARTRTTPKIRAIPARRPPTPAILTPATRRKRARKVPALRGPRRKSPKSPPKRTTPITAVSMTRTPVISRSPSTSKRTLRATRPLS